VHFLTLVVSYYARPEASPTCGVKPGLVNSTIPWVEMLEDEVNETIGMQRCHARHAAVCAVQAEVSCRMARSSSCSVEIKPQRGSHGNGLRARRQQQRNDILQGLPLVEEFLVYVNRARNISESMSHNSLVADVIRDLK
jgi:hypothetical protein